MAWAGRAIGAVIFDLDGLLIDSEPLWRQAEIEVFGSLGLTLTEAQVRKTMGLRIDDAVRHWWDRHRGRARRPSRSNGWSRRGWPS